MSDSEDEVEYDNEYFNIRGIDFNITTVAYMPLSKLMKLREKETEISGQKLWCGSLVLIEYLLDHADFIVNCSVLELGSGTGVVGMLAKKLGALEVYLTDHDMKSLEHMKQDSLKNSIETNVITLDWFNFNITQLSTEFLTTNPLRVLAGDVLYKHTLIQPFFTVVEQLLQIPGSQMLLCHVPRAGVNQQDVIDAATNFGLNILAVPSELWKKGVCLEYSIPDDYERAQLYIIQHS